MKQRNGQTGIGSIPTIAVTLLVAVFALFIGASMTQDVREDTCVDDGFIWNGSSNTCTIGNNSPGGGYATNISQSGLDGITEISNWLDTIGLVIAAAIVISVLSMLFIRYRT